MKKITRDLDSDFKIEDVRTLVIWTSFNQFLWTFYAQFNFPTRQISNTKKENEFHYFISRCIVASQKLITDKFCVAFKLQVILDKGVIWFSSCDHVSAAGVPEIKTQNNSDRLLLPRAYFQSLTKREKEVLLFISRHYKQSEIAYLLNISLDTFKSHRKSIYRKLNFSNKTELMEWTEDYLDVIVD